MDAVVRLGREDIAVLLVEQNALAALDVCGRGYFMDKGTIAGSGTAGALLADTATLERTLGVSAADVGQAP
jgi:branched-chain amino acid transport system ATP-binding protein